MSEGEHSGNRNDSRENNEDEENTFKIMIATDTHLGYLEKDPIRGDDSFNSFEEMLQLAVENEVDFILLAGDLFHDGKPTSKTVTRCMRLLRHYCMGERPIAVEFLSDPATNFQHLSNPNVNYMDPNVNIAYPIFSIHGNHDDPLGAEGTCTLDELSNAGLVNYFGRQTDLKNVVLNPILMKKGSTQLAMYGLGALKEKFAHRLLRNNQVTLLRPGAETGKWFNILLIHQNRAKHAHDEYVPESFLPQFIDLVVWGHEHENRLKAEWSNEKGFFITQPGSSVATSLSEGEAKPKEVGLLRVRGDCMKLKRLSLKTVRPFVFRSISLRTAEEDLETPCLNLDKKVQTYLERVVEEMLEEAELQRDDERRPELPLIRLRVEFTRPDQMFNLVRFGLQFQGKIANTTDIISLKKKVKKDAVGLRDEDVMDELAMENIQGNSDLHTVEDFIKKYFEEAEHSKQMKVLSVDGLNDAMQVYIKRSDAQAIEDLIEYQARKTEKYLLEKNCDEIDLEQEIQNLRELRMQAPDKETQEIRAMLQDNKARETLRTSMDVTDLTGDDDDVAMDDIDTANKTARGGRGRARATRSRARGGRGRGRGTVDDDTEEDLFSPSSKPTRGPGSRGGRGRATKTAAKPANTSLGQLNISMTSTQARPQRAKAGNRMNFLNISDSESD